MEQVIKIFIALVRSEILEVPVEPKILNKITPEIMEELYMVSKNHDLAHVVAVALKKHGLIKHDKLSRRYVKQMHAALMRYEAIKHEQNQIYQVFEKEGIDFVPLKGSVIRKYYPDRWMRTSTDIDILVREKELEKAKKALISNLDYAEGRYRYHDVSLYSKSGVLLELHFQITENMKNIDKNLKKVWDYVNPIEEGRCRQVMTPEYLLFHSYAHMIYHFVKGGCGVRFVVDSWLLEHVLDYDEDVFQKLCKESRINTFVESVRKLGQVWFEDAEHDNLSEKMQTYIITGGVFGTVESKVMARKTQTSGRYRYLLKRVFIPYKDFCASYPILEKLPWLYPYFAVKRLFKIFDKRIAKNAVQEIHMNKNVLQEDVDELKGLFRDLKL